MVGAIIIGCGKGNKGEGRVYDGIDHTSASERDLRARIKALKFLSHNHPEKTSSIVFEHSKTGPAKKRCSFLKVKFNCWKNSESVEKKYKYNGGAIHLGDTEEEANENEILAYRNKIKSHLLNVVLSPNVIKQITIIPFSSGSSYHPSIRRAAAISLSLGGRGYYGSLIKVVHGSPVGGGPWNNAVYYFSFDVPLEANPIFEGRSSFHTSGQTYRYKYLSKGTVTFP